MRLRLIASTFVALLATTACNVLLPPAPSDVILTGPPAAARKIYKPLIESFTAEPSNLVPRGTPVSFQVVTNDPTDPMLQLRWSATAGTLSTDTGNVVSWIPPKEPGVYVVSVIVTNRKGGFVTGIQNLTVQPDGATRLVGPIVASPPPPTPAPAPISITDSSEQ